MDDNITTEEAVKYAKDILKYPKLYASTGREEDFLRGIDKNKIEKVLNELDKYKELYVRALDRSLNNSIQQSNKNNEDLEALNEGWKIECQKKDARITALQMTHNYDVKMIDDVKGEAVKLYKIIDAMARMIESHDIDDDICMQMGKEKECDKFDNKENCIQCIIQYFRRKIEGGNG